MAITLKAARVNADMTRPEVIEHLIGKFGIKISINTLSNYENKQSQPGVLIAKALASIYGVSVNDITFD